MIDIVRLVLGDNHASWSPLDALSGAFQPVADKVIEGGQHVWRYRPPFSAEAFGAGIAAGHVVTAQKRTEGGGFVLLAKRPTAGRVTP